MLKSSKGMTSYNEWFISAIKSSKGLFIQNIYSKLNAYLIKIKYITFGFPAKVLSSYFHLAIFVPEWM